MTAPDDAAPGGQGGPDRPSRGERRSADGEHHRFPDAVDAVEEAVEEAVEDVLSVARRSFLPVVAVLLVLAGVNLLTNEVAPGLYLVWAWTGVAVLLLIARRDGESWRDLGLGPVTRRAAIAAMVVVLLVLAVYLVAALLPATREAFGDDRVADLSTSELLLRSLVRVPLGTVLLEEVAFRGVLLAMLWRRVGVVAGMVASSVAFGLWHILPSLGLSSANEAVGGVFGSGTDAQIGAVVAAVVFTTLAGLVFCELRRRFDHLIVPMALHWATNGLGYLFAWAIVTGRVF